MNKNTVLHKLLAQVWQGLGNNVRARIKDNGRFGWYMPPLQSMPKTSDLVICDGPPQQTTLAGRYGLLPAMNDRLKFPPFCDRKGAPADCGTVNDFTLMVVRWDLLGAY